MMKRIIYLISFLCLFTAFVFAVSAASENLGLSIGKSGNMYFTYEYTDSSFHHGYASYSKSNLTLHSNSGSYSVTDITFSGLDEKRSSYTGVNPFTMLSLRYTLTANTSSLSGKVLRYSIRLDYDVEDAYGTVVSLADRNNYASNGIGLSSDDITSTMPNYASVYFPATSENYSLTSLNSSSAFGGSHYDELVISGSISDITTINKMLGIDGAYSYFVFYLPFIACDEQLRIYSSFELVDASDISSGSSSGSSSAPDLTNPVLIDIPLYQRFKTVDNAYGPLSSTTAIKFYRASAQSNTSVEDVSDYLVVSRLPLMSNYYPMLLGVGLADNSYETRISEADIIQLSLPLAFSRNYAVSSDQVDNGLQSFDSTKKYGYHLDVYFAFNESSFEDYTDLIAWLNSSVYSYEPFSISFGSLTIPWDYFNLEYGYSYHTCRLSLDLDPDIEVERSFINIIKQFSGTSDVVLKLSLPSSCYNNTMIGITNGGFYEKGTIVIPGVSGETTDNPSGSSGITQVDLDAAFNRGYNQGISDGSDKNYVYGFINGIFSGFNQFYKTVTQGISIGGITLASVITSMCIVMLFVFIIKKVT